MFVVIGATGIVGREALDLLLAAGHEVAAVTRDPGAALPGGVRIVHGDPRATGQGGLTALPNGVEAVLLSTRAVGGAAAEVLALAEARGARRVVVLSSATVEHPAGHRRFADEFRAVEGAVRDSGLRWTFLRCADFAANALAWAPQIRATGVVRGAHGAAVTSPIHQRDIAEVAVRALVDREGAAHAGRAHLLTGPRPLDQRDKVRLIGEAVGRDLSFQELDPEQVRRAMLAQGLPEDVPERLLGSLADYARTPGPATDTVEKLLGRPARTFAAWAAENAAAFTAPARS
ncbi:NAD(P)H-binding protein [Streptomyces corynorhini]|uniref:NmrA family transcriptional regulator n=1 Tax=Streptomyces corynorhini TaxID=2282652 RepID=A0A370B631_9ACTN|nr:NAD(P)H-binding protein [Streptomyces corynorhini]RDG37260.1 NmrA family transcriptional regulator [Streptomyces corynorhini]